MKKAEFKKKFSERFKDAMDGRSQTAVAKRIGYSQGVLSKYVLGEVPESIQIFLKLSEELEIDLHFLITGQHSPVTTKTVQALKPYVMEHLTMMMKKKEDLVPQLLDLMRRRPTEGVDVEEDISKISKELTQIDSYCSEMVKTVNIVLDPLGEGIRFDW